MILSKLVYRIGHLENINNMLTHMDSEKLKRAVHKYVDDIVDCEVKYGYFRDELGFG
jgi:hypothetical protein